MKENPTITPNAEAGGWSDL